MALVVGNHDLIFLEAFPESPAAPFLHNELYINFLSHFILGLWLLD
jgi:hypothetical protein